MYECVLNVVYSSRPCKQLRGANVIAMMFLVAVYGGSVGGGSHRHEVLGVTQGSHGRRKRTWTRAVFSSLQRKGLEKRFQLQKYITKPDRRQLAATLGLTDAQVCLGISSTWK